MQNVWLVLVGLLAGVLSGLFGIGGGIVIVPALALLMGFSQARASGTSLVAMLLPVGALGAWEYYRAGKIGAGELQGGLAIACGLLMGAFLGAKIAVGLPEATLKKAFAVLMVVAAVRMWPFEK